MACEDEKQRMEDAQAKTDEAEAYYWVAYDTQMQALEALQAAEAEQMACTEEHWILEHVGWCSDSVEAVEAARSDYEDAITEREQAYSDWQEAMEEYNAAIDVYCDCLIMNPGPVED